jgi:hypothetical protein
VATHLQLALKFRINTAITPLPLCVFMGGFGGLVVSMLASGTQDRGFEPGPSDFSGKKFHSMPSFGVEVKPPKKEPCNLRGNRNRRPNRPAISRPIPS